MDETEEVTFTSEDLPNGYVIRYRIGPFWSGIRRFASRHEAWFFIWDRKGLDLFHAYLQGFRVVPFWSNTRFSDSQMEGFE